jgi:hypothetical protein
MSSSDSSFTSSFFSSAAGAAAAAAPPAGAAAATGAAPPPTNKFQYNKCISPFKIELEFLMDKFMTTKAKGDNFNTIHPIPV